MIYCLSLNPSLDKTVTVPAFSLDATNRVRLERADVAGKAVNIARALAALGCPTKLVGFDYRNRPIRGAMEGWDIACDLKLLPGDLRVNLKIRDLSAGHTIEINEAGAAVTMKEISYLLAETDDACAPGDWVALSGSLPPGAALDTYRELCRGLRRKGGLVAVDCDGDALKTTLEAGPDLIKPNAQEFRMLTGVDAHDRTRALAACRDLHDRGVSMVCLSLGAEGALFSCREGAYFCPAANVRAIGVQGAGDNMLAGMLFALSRGDVPVEAFRYACACGGASVMQPGTVPCQPEDVETLMASLIPEKIA